MTPYQCIPIGVIVYWTWVYTTMCSWNHHLFGIDSTNLKSGRRPTARSSFLLQSFASRTYVNTPSFLQFTVEMCWNMMPKSGIMSAATTTHPHPTTAEQHLWPFWSLVLLRLLFHPFAPWFNNLILFLQQGSCGASAIQTSWREQQTTIFKTSHF